MKARLAAVLERMSPTVALVWRLAADKQVLLRENDVLRSELSVAKCREARWKRAAYTACEGNPQAIRLLKFQEASDAIADADEIDDIQRNTAPRPLP